ncbi:hypothetical protein BTZ20_3747 [Rhodococcus sp. MTM3W5.2]|nr:hypothetical protein BTZ20_3747 [Rhodococcus sp. MTM3W5.2]
MDADVVDGWLPPMPVRVGRGAWYPPAQSVGTGHPVARRRGRCAAAGRGGVPVR